MPEKKKLDDTEINRLKAIVGMETQTSVDDDAGKLSEALENLEAEKKKLEDLKKTLEYQTSVMGRGVRTHERKEETEDKRGSADSSPSHKGSEDVKLKESAKKLMEKLKDSKKLKSEADSVMHTSGLRIGGVKKAEKDLFVKIDEHREIAEQLLVAKEAIKEIAETVELLAKAESIKEEAIKRLEVSLDRIEHAWKRALELLEEGDKTYPEYYDEQTMMKGDEYYQLKVELERLRKILEKIK